MTEFSEKGYVVIRNILDTKEYFNYAKENEDKGIIDPQCPGSPSFYKFEKISILQERLKLLIEKISEFSLFVTYNYFRIYKKGTVLKPHTDRPACEISMSLNLGGDDWEIGCFSYDNIPEIVLLKPGDGLVYHGCDLVHWRPGKFKGNELIQIFLHYVRQDGPNAWCKDDILR